MPFNRTWPGYQRAKDQTELASYIYLTADETLTFEIECARSFEKCVIRPLHSRIEYTRQNQVVRFTVQGGAALKNKYVVLELDGEHFPLHIFINKPQNYSEKDQATYYFGPGVHCPGLIRLKSGDRVYIDEGAVVYASLYGENVTDVKIFGHGVLDGSHEERLFEHCYETYTKGNIKFYESSNIEIEGVVLSNSAIWVINLFACENVKISGVKIIGQWRYNTDGIDVVNSNDVIIENCFIRVFDDVITLKGIDKYAGRNVFNIHVRDCVLWCSWGRTCEVGIETAAEEYDNITFEDCDLINNSFAAIDIQNGGYATIHNVKFTNLRVEYRADAREPIYQHTDDQVYAPSENIWVPHLIFSDNYKFGSTEGKNAVYGMTHDITYDEIYVYTEEGVPAPHIHIESRSSDAQHVDFTFGHFYLNGVKVDPFKAFIVKTNENVKL
ncbi:glycosyl hydrolase family 28 protein [Paenibacillus mendelii]|uniref:Glycosyl hydrolase family 28 protein n=1 Tax=Paenibacillus mendelii TaxID=206163 RepID=A0ABV6J880_9BACL|nr:glycosyl hydrolase family 28 protein [Paenibacillus mendelii]MCQ6561257.1 glycosyl hydrolase family 28 protein [Paenibacillus mendelii]